MPICIVEGPAGLTPATKKELIGSLLNAMVAAYQMPDDRVFIHEHSLVNTGHTALSEGEADSIQLEPARPVCTFLTPPGLPMEARRVLVHTATHHLARAYGISDLKEVLIFIHEYPLVNVGNNGMLQSENPAFASPATA